MSATLLNLARAGNADAAAALWRAIDAGQVSDAVAAAWARDVSVQVVAKVLNTDIPANRRAENARAALGLEGRIDQNWELAELAMAHPEVAPALIANAAEFFVDVGKASPSQIKRKIEYIRGKKNK